MPNEKTAGQALSAIVGSKINAQGSLALTDDSLKQMVAAQQEHQKREDLVELTIHRKKGELTQKIQATQAELEKTDNQLSGVKHKLEAAIESQAKGLKLQENEALLQLCAAADVLKPLALERKRKPSLEWSPRTTREGIRTLLVTALFEDAEQFEVREEVEENQDVADQRKAIDELEEKRSELHTRIKTLQDKVARLWAQRDDMLMTLRDRAFRESHDGGESELESAYEELTKRVGD